MHTLNTQCTYAWFVINVTRQFYFELTALTVLNLDTADYSVRRSYELFYLQFELNEAFLLDRTAEPLQIV